MRKHHAVWLLAMISVVPGCAVDTISTKSSATPRPERSTPKQYFAYTTGTLANTLIVIDSSTYKIVNKVKHADMVHPANGIFHPNRKRFYAGGVGKITVWNTTDMANPVYLKTVTPAAGSTGEYRGLIIYKGTPNAHDGDLWLSNVHDATVYVYRVADIEGASPAPVATFDKARYPFLNRPHYLGLRPGSSEIWMGNRPATAKGTVVRFDGDTRTVVTTPSTTLETTAIVGDEPNEIDFNKDGTLAYIGHHGHPTTGSPAASPHIAIVDAANFTVKTNLSVSPGYETPAYVDTDYDKGFVYFCTKWGRAGPALAIMDIASERFMRYIDVGGFGACYDVQTTPDKKFIFLGIGLSSPAPNWFGQGAVVAIDATTYTIAANIIDTDMFLLRSVHFAR